MRRSFAFNYYVLRKTGTQSRNLPFYKTVRFETISFCCEQKGHTQHRLQALLHPAPLSTCLLWLRQTLPRSIQSVMYRYLRDHVFCPLISHTPYNITKLTGRRSKLLCLRDRPHQPLLPYGLGVKQKSIPKLMLEKSALGRFLTAS